MVKTVSVVFVILFVFFFSSEHLFAQSSDLRNVEALILKDEYSQAARECKKILTQHHRTAIKSKAHYLLGICLLKEGEFSQARKNFNIILCRYPRTKFSDDASLSVADSYFLGGDYKQASIKYKEFLQGFPHSKLSSIARTQQELCKRVRPFTNSYFSVQVGCFAKKRNAEKLRDELIDSGYQAYILELQNESLYRVRVGRFNNRLQAEFLEQKLKAEGFSTKVCP